MIRRLYDLPACPKELPQATSEVSTLSKLGLCETDILTILHQKGLGFEQLSQHIATVELKHNANRLCKGLLGQQLLQKINTWTSTILPGSRLLLVGVPLSCTQQVVELAVKD